MNDALLLTDADVEALARRLAGIIVDQFGSPIAKSERRLVDRPTMAKLANIGTATLDRLVAARKVPSVLIGKRRLFDPDATIDALIEAKEIYLESTSM